MSFTGVTIEQLRSPYAPTGAEALLEQLDLLIDGLYVESLVIHSSKSLVSSSNQRVHVFNPVLSDRLTWTSDQMEIHVLKDGSRIITGYRGQMNLSD
jgi:anaerobic ribonucleoside-triphosphate reductase activating protein